MIITSLIKYSRLVKVYFIQLIFLMCFSFISTSKAQTNWYWENPKPQGNHLTGIHAFNNADILISGHSGVLVRSNDGLKTLKMDYLPEELKGNYNDMMFISPLIGFMVGNNGNVLKKQLMAVKTGR